MALLINNVRVADPKSPHHDEVMDIFLDDEGKIGFSSTGEYDEIDGSGQYLSPSWIDTFADFGNPGFEHRERIANAMAAAQAGGFGTVFILPNTKPTISNASQVASLASKLQNQSVTAKILGAVSQNIEGKELAEMLDMRAAGAIAFTDGWQPIQDSLLMQQGLQYLKTFNGIILQLPINEKMNTGGLMHEGEQSVALGVPGMPAMAEQMMIQRDIDLVRYTNSRLHIVGISTAAGLKLIAAAKLEGLHVTCSVSPYHLLWTADKLNDYDSHYKMNPPLRSETDRQALIAGLQDGSIDCICSLHQPHNWDEKEQELDYAANGLAGIEMVWPILLAAAPKVSVANWLDLLVYNPAKIFELKIGCIAAGEKGSYTLFNTDSKYIISEKNKKSYAYNVPFLGQELKGSAKVL